jgi:hypothetical protein
MGLDMYLDKSLLVSEFDWDKELINKVYDMLGVTDESNNYQHLYIKLPAIYWRKANSIHDWFVQNVQHGQDDCRDDYFVSKRQLVELLALVQKQKNAKMGEFLKPTDGFCFGPTDNEERFQEDMKYTEAALERELAFIAKEAKRGRDWTYTYSSSW